MKLWRKILKKMNQTKRLLAHHVIFEGREYGLSFIEINRDSSGRWHTSVQPFAGETYSTAFVDGTVEIVSPADPDGEPQIIVKR